MFTLRKYFVNNFLQVLAQLFFNDLFIYFLNCIFVYNKQENMTWTWTSLGKHKNTKSKKQKL